MDDMELVRSAAGFICARIEKTPEVALVLGSGLGELAEKISHKVEIAYPEIPGFPVSTVAGHAGKLVIGELEGTQVVCLSGRFHYYEGYEMKDTAFYVRVLKLLGIHTLLLTNAAGGINVSFVPGDLMLITDHFKFFDDSPLRGKNSEEFGPRFPDMSNAYDKGLRAVAKEAAKKAQIELKEGVYAYMPGPSYETPAEIRALRVLGADAVGMSTVPETITAVHCGMKVLGISCITNMAAGILDQPLSHQEVFETAQRVKEKFSGLVLQILKEIKS